MTWPQAFVIVLPSDFWAAGASVSIYACALLLVCVGIAIVRADFLGVPRLAGRWTIRVALAAVLLTAEAIVVGFGAQNAAQEWNWPALATAVAAGVLIAPGALVLWPRLTSRVERILLHDVYDPADTLRQFGIALAHAEAHTVGQLVVALVGAKLDLRFAVLLTVHEQYVHRHLRSPMPVMLVEEVTYRAQALITTEPLGDTVADRAQDMPVLFLPIRQGVAAPAMLCCGPKYSGEGYTTQRATLHKMRRCSAPSSNTWLFSTPSNRLRRNWRRCSDAAHQAADR